MLRNSGKLSECRQEYKILVKFSVTDKAAVQSKSYNVHNILSVRPIPKNCDCSTILRKLFTIVNTNTDGL